MKEFGQCATEDLDKLAELLREWGIEIIAPAQWLVNLMAMIPKTVATMASGYRVYAGLDDESERQWNVENSHEDDSSKPNASCLRAAEERLIEQEILSLNGYDTLVVLWDFVKFYDTIRYGVLRRECDSNNYGRRKTAMSMMVHVAPRKLKMGKAVSSNTKSVGRGIIAGCKRNQSIAKAYTNRSVDKLTRSFIVFVLERNTKYENTPKKRAEVRKKKQCKGGIRVFQHVDDLTHIMWAKNEGDLADRSYNSVSMWARKADCNYIRSAAIRM